MGVEQKSFERKKISNNIHPKIIKLMQLFLSGTTLAFPQERPLEQVNLKASDINEINYYQDAHLEKNIREVLQNYSTIIKLYSEETFENFDRHRGIDPEIDNLIKKRNDLIEKYWVTIENFTRLIEEISRLIRDNYSREAGNFLKENLKKINLFDILDEFLDKTGVIAEQIHVLLDEHYFKNN